MPVNCVARRAAVPAGRGGLWGWVVKGAR